LTAEIDAYPSKMRALAVANPSATSMTGRTRDVIVRALASELKLDLVETTRRGHAADLAAEARADGVDIVVAIGGDGTVSEVVTGLLRAPAGDPEAALPRLAVVPAGNANVFARALGLPAQPIEATGVVIELLRTDASRWVSLGKLTTDSVDRWFTFCAGFGLDAEIVREVEKRRGAGVRATPSLYMRTGLRQFLATERRHPALRLVPDSDVVPAIDDVFLAIITNTTPWTYFGDRPLEPTPSASFDTALDLFGLRRLGTAGTAWRLRQLLRGRTPADRHVVAWHDVPALRMEAARPVAFQVDGDYLGECTSATVGCRRAALEVVA
jgi:diacylglycerol kinase family enzyme